MKRKTIFSLLLFFVLVFLLGLPVSAADGGRQVTKAGETYTVFQNGTCQAALGEKETVWVCVENREKSMWVGIQNRAGLFEKESLFHVRLLTEEENPKEFQAYRDLVDASKQEETEIRSLFLIGVTSPEGKEIQKLSGVADLYFELSSDFDKEDLKALFLGEDMDENIQMELAEITGPEGRSEFAILHFPHFGMPVVFQNREPLYMASVFGGNHPLIFGLMGTAVLIAAALIVKKKKA